MNGVGFSYYDILGVSPNATAEEIKAAYRSAVRKYHPDVNTAPNAQRLTEMLNDAYAVLSDAQRRREYDASMGNGRSVNDVQETSEQNWNLYACDRCGRIDAQLRYALFFRVWSILIYTQMKGDGGVLCPECRSRLAVSTVLFSAILGPWGFPWGILYTLRALFASIRGGEMPRNENAQLLRHQGIAFLQRGFLNEAKTALTAAQRFEKNQAVAELLANQDLFGILTVLPPQGWLKGQTVALFACAIPVILVFILFAVVDSTDTSPTGSPATTTDASEVQPVSSPANAKQADSSSSELTPNESACLKDRNNEKWFNAYSDCRAARQDTAARISANSSTADREEYALIGALEEFTEAMGAYKSGYGDTAKQLGREAINKFDELHRSATDAHVRSKAKDYYDCLYLDKCAK